MFTKPLMCRRIVWVKFNGATELSFSSREVVIEVLRDLAQRRMGLRQVWINVQRLQNRLFRFGHKVPGWFCGVCSFECVAIRQPGIRQSITWIFGDSVLKETYGPVEIRACSFVPVKASP